MGVLNEKICKSLGVYYHYAYNLKRSLKRRDHKGTLVPLLLGSLTHKPNYLED